MIQVNPGDTPADGRFEVGSLTKTMTATVLALLAADGSLRLDDEVGRWLPAGANAGITVRQLATHTSGLPRMAPNMSLPTVDLANPYAEFGAGQAEEGLREAVAAPVRASVFLISSSSLQVCRVHRARQHRRIKCGSRRGFAGLR